jgi:hypothetical protein
MPAPAYSSYVAPEKYAQLGCALPELARAAFEDPSLRTNPRMPLVSELLRAAWRGRP